MTVEALAKQLNMEICNLPCGDREIHGCYCGDLLSWVMGRAQADDAWITIMTNVNVAAVASLVDVACVILAEGTRLSDDALKKVEDAQINLLISNKTAFEICCEIGKQI